MIVELHLLQNFVPANLNRDDTGSPKDCLFGGYRRARISSQCFKRAIRTEFTSASLLAEPNLSQRTKRLVETLAKQLAIYPPLSGHGITEQSARPIAAALLTALGLTVVKDDKTEYLLFLTQSEIQALTGLAAQHWDQLQAAAKAIAAAQTSQERARAEKELLPKNLTNPLQTRSNGGRAADLALFGRMIADLPDRNVEAACQVAHAISTNKVDVEFDFYTAVDDLKPEDTAGADMLGTVEFNSACFYRYASVSTDQLLANLGGDANLAHRTLEAFLHASVEAIPTGKQNSMAAHNPPSLVMIVVRERGQWNLANAFLRPIRPFGDHDLMRSSITALDDYWARLSGVYGTDGFNGPWLTSTEPEPLSHLQAQRLPSVAAVISSALAAVHAQHA